MNIHDFQKLKAAKQPISMITCYGFPNAQIIADTDIDCILVGDSSAMVIHGHDSTVTATVEMIATHIRAVNKGAGNKFIIGDLPFCSYRKGQAAAIDAAATLMQAGCHAVKLEGADGNLDIIRFLIGSGIPVMGHLGLTPQSVNTLGGFKLQGKQADAAKKIAQDALALEKAGCFSLVLECVPATLGKDISESLSIPTIGIGAGPHTDGQVLVLQDMLGMSKDFNPKFVKQYLQGYDLIKNALNAYHQDVKARTFPDIKQHSFKG